MRELHLRTAVRFVSPLMANPEHVAWFKSQVKTWNEKTRNDHQRKKKDRQPRQPLALNELDLSEADLRGFTVRSVDLSRSNLSGANFRKSNFQNVNLSGCNLEKANLEKVNLDRCKLHSANLTQARIQGADFGHSNLKQAILTQIECAHRSSFVAAKLHGADLSHSDFKRSNFGRADLTDANLSHTSLVEARLRQAVMKGAMLQSADLTEAQLPGADLTRACLTGACIESWHPRKDTNLSQIRCDYVYQAGGDRERRPHSGIFKPGEFAALFQQAFNTLDLIFVEGIDWQAFFASFQELRQRYDDANLAIQAIEKKSCGSFVVRLEVAQDADKAMLQQAAETSYNHQLQLIETRYQAQLQAKDEVIDTYKNLYSSQSADMKKQSADMLAIVQTLASAERKQYNQYNYGDSTGFQNDVDNSTVNQGKAIDITQESPAKPDPQ